MSFHRGGFNPSGSPLWTDIHELIDNVKNFLFYSKMRFFACFLPLFVIFLRKNAPNPAKNYYNKNAGFYR